jgi:hypothetical protein
MMTSWEYKVMKTEISIWSGKEKTNPEQFLSLCNTKICKSCVF